VAGASARREFERRKVKREVLIRSRHPHVGGLLLAISDEPQTTRNWATGAEGERQLGASLDGLAPAGVIALHDRVRPGTTANIDHMAVTPSGVWVIDAKRYAGQVTKKDVGGWFSTDARLFVGRRDCMKLVSAMSKQVAASHGARPGPRGNTRATDVVLRRRRLGLVRQAIRAQWRAGDVAESGP
jgi:hypothetical protein